ncbi:hypothetical protein ACFL22_01100, partial [Patescibacteria group bacterium]
MSDTKTKHPPANDVKRRNTVIYLLDILKRDCKHEKIIGCNSDVVSDMTFGPMRKCLHCNKIEESATERG